MGVAKAALQSSIRYLAKRFRDDIRINVFQQDQLRHCLQKE